MARKYYNDNFSVLGIDKGDLPKVNQEKTEPNDEKVIVRYDAGGR